MAEPPLQPYLLFLRDFVHKYVFYHVPYSVTSDSCNSTSPCSPFPILLFSPHPLHNSPLSAWRKACLLKILIALSALVSFQLLSWCSGISCASVVGGFPGSPVWLYSVPLVSFQVFILKSLQIWSKSGRKHSPRRSYLLSSIFPSQMPHFVI